MNSPELLRFFQTEATEYLEAIDALLREAMARGPGGAPDGAAFVSAARALRGTATMARLPRIAEVALLLERIANALRDGEIAWSEPLQPRLVGTVAELRTLVGAVEQWAEAQENAAARILAELQELLPRSPERPHSPSAPTSVAPIFIALQTSAIASALDRLTEEGPKRELVADVIARLKALHGMAGFSDHRELASAAEQLESALRELPPDTLLSASDLHLLRAGAVLFHKASADLRSRGQFGSTAELDDFVEARAQLSGGASSAEIVPIERLFYSDSGPHILRRAESPPATPPAKPAAPAPARSAPAVEEARPPVNPAGPSKGTSGTELRHILAQSLARLHPLDEAEPLAEPVPLEVEQIVPIESLLYRGDAALRRAIEIRDALRASGHAEPEALEELYDLLDLARTRD